MSRPLTPDELATVVRTLEFAANDLRYHNRTPADAKVEATISAVVADQLTGSYLVALAAANIMLKPVPTLGEPGADMQFLVNLYGSWVVQPDDPFPFRWGG